MSLMRSVGVAMTGEFVMRVTVMEEVVCPPLPPPVAGRMNWLTTSSFSVIWTMYVWSSCARFIRYVF